MSILAGHRPMSGCKAAYDCGVQQWQMKCTLAGNIWLKSVLAPLCSDFGIGSNDPTADAGGSPLLSPAAIAGVVLAVVIALLCAAALIGKLQSTLHVIRTLPPGIEQTCSTCPRVSPHYCSQAGMQQPLQEATVLWCCQCSNGRQNAPEAAA